MFSVFLFSAQVVTTSASDEDNEHALPTSLDEVESAVREAVTRFAAAVSEAAHPAAISVVPLVISVVSDEDSGDEQNLWRLYAELEVSAPEESSLEKEGIQKMLLKEYAALPEADNAIVRIDLHDESAWDLVVDIEFLRSVRADERADAGVMWQDANGVPMIGTGHCHNTAYQSADDDLIMAGGWFRHPSGYYYEHSWLKHAASGTIVDSTADQWHLQDFQDVAIIEPHDPRLGMYVEGDLMVDQNGYLLDGDFNYRPRNGFNPGSVPSDPRQR